MENITQNNTVKIVSTFLDSANQAINMTTVTYKFYKKLKKESIVDPDTLLSLRNELNTTVGVYEFLIDLDNVLELDQSREVLEITIIGEDSETIKTSNVVTVNVVRSKE